MVPVLVFVLMLLSPYVFAARRRWDVGAHLQGYGRAVKVLFTETGKFQVI